VYRRNREPRADDILIPLEQRRLSYLEDELETAEARIEEIESELGQKEAPNTSVAIPENSKDDESITAGKREKDGPTVMSTGDER
jgi:hypothetical protein